MEAILLGVLATALTQVAKKFNVSGRLMAFIVALFLSCGYYLVGRFVSAEALDSLWRIVLEVWATSVLVYDYVVRKLLSSAK